MTALEKTRLARSVLGWTDRWKPVLRGGGDQSVLGGGYGQAALSSPTEGSGGGDYSFDVFWSSERESEYPSIMKMSGVAPQKGARKETQSTLLWSNRVPS